MELGATILGQMITFAIFIWFTMRFIWPLLETAMQERKRKIADGLAAAEKGQHFLAKAREDINKELQASRNHRDVLIAQANKQAEKILAVARKEAEQEREAILLAGRQQIERELESARSELQGHFANVAMLGAEKILKRSINKNDHQDLLQEMVDQI